MLLNSLKLSPSPCAYSTVSASDNSGQRSPAAYSLVGNGRTSPSLKASTCNSPSTTLMRST